MDETQGGMKMEETQAGNEGGFEGAMDETQGGNEAGLEGAMDETQGGNEGGSRGQWMKHKGEE